MNNTITGSNGCTTFSGPSAVAVYRATALASACKLYANTKMQVNRLWTATAMLKTAESITGKKI